MTISLRPPQRAPRRRTVLATSVVVLTILGLGIGPGERLASTAAAATGCSGVESDFNGDGVRDVVIADPEAAVGGKERAGLVRIVYGGGSGGLELSQDSAGIPNAAEPGDEFGHALAVYDANADGCSDIVIGSPYEDIATNVDAGLVQIVYGAPTGLNSGKAVTEHFQGSNGTLGGGAESGDWTGYALAAGTSSAGTPYLLIGAPGEALGSSEDAGVFFYVHGTTQTVTGIHQDSTTGGAVPGALETDDRFGASLAAAPTHFAVGSPGEAIGTTTFAGGVAVFSHTLLNGSPKTVLGLGQDVDGVSGTAEAGDGFGTSLAMVPYRPSGATSTTESLLAVGVPGEDLSTTVDAGAVQNFRIKTSDTFSQHAWVDQNSLDVEGEGEAGDFFGQRLAAVNTAPNSVSTGASTRLAIGAPGEESAEEHREKGGVHIVPMIGAAGASDAWIEPGYGIPSEAAALQLAGLSLASSPAGLYVGMPYGPAGGHGVHLFPWAVANGGAPTQSFRPGEGGIPASDIAFGAAVR
ncbi:VCBS repeat-containing protein [Streptomyces peucetius]|uniref:VCBS repeat-containing protein n=1 Tax=Streptomyces peucetius TaxID=1950 RepID=A0ABY6IFL1_STRPE|nr:VCBS repeat-containing protein [Streptomyces peucetius]UYQ64480.1 VCBS repeat-containing protein [Streptomyces peucetius]